MLELLTGSIIGQSLTVSAILLCTIASLILGLGVAGIYMFRNHYSKGLAVALALLPAIVQAVIMLVNGNLGTGVAVMGAFSLVRFRSVPGNARDISSIFLAMAVGLATGMGYVFYAALFLALIGAASMLLICSGLGREKQDLRILRVTIPETLDYDTLFDDLFQKYTDHAELDRVKTTNMGSLYELSYSVRLKSGMGTKEFIDELRCRNGNLNILLGRQVTGKEEL